MNLHRVLRAANRLNPTTRGKHRVVSLAMRCHSLPPSGVYDVGCGLRMHLRADQFIDRSIYFHAYEPCLSRVLSSRLRSGGVFLDVGANIGYYTLMAARKVGSAGRVYAFEPNPPVSSRLAENVVLNGLGNVELHRCALSDASADMCLYVPADEVGNGHASLCEQGWTAAERVTVRTQRLDDLLLPQLARCDLVKIDAEGAELAVLRGARELVRRFWPDVIVELNSDASRRFGYLPPELADFLAKCQPSYRFRFIDGHSARDISLAELTRDPQRIGDLLAYVPTLARRAA